MKEPIALVIDEEIFDKLSEYCAGELIFLEGVDECDFIGLTELEKGRQRIYFANHYTTMKRLESTLNAISEQIDLGWSMSVKG